MRNVHQGWAYRMSGNVLPFYFAAEFPFLGFLSSTVHYACRFSRVFGISTTSTKTTTTTTTRDEKGRPNAQCISFRFLPFLPIPEEGERKGEDRCVIIHHERISMQSDNPTWRQLLAMIDPVLLIAMPPRYHKYTPRDKCRGRERVEDYSTIEFRRPGGKPAASGSRHSEIVFRREKYDARDSSASRSKGELELSRARIARQVLIRRLFNFCKLLARPTPSP